MRRTKKRQGFCQRCSGLYAITRDGTPTTHHITETRGGVYTLVVRERCDGSDVVVPEKDMFS